MIETKIPKEKWFKINLVTTGGTIEKTYDEQDGTLFNRETVIKNKINDRLRLPYTEVCVHSIMSLDSLDMNDNDRFVINDKITTLLEEENPIVILHGTDTMQQTAELVSKNHAHLLVPIIFTGAMKPLGFEDSDALQNVTEAFMAAQLAKPGVYICFHNKLFSVPGARKNKELGTFEFSLE